MMRLQKILSAAGVASRRAAEVLISQGRVSVNGTVVRELGTKADPERDEIRVDGRRLRAAPARRYILLNKPAGYVTTRSDPRGRPTVLDLLPRNVGYLYPVGRLDYESDGLLLLTNDGELAERMTHPRHEVEKVYHAVVRGVPSPATLDSLCRGVVIEGRRTAPAKVRLIDTLVRRGRDEALLELVLHEGRNRQVRRMCAKVGHPVERLSRLRLGPLGDTGLTPGAWRVLTPREVTALRRATSRAPSRRPGPASPSRRSR